jgi:hypothetical protein
MKTSRVITLAIGIALTCPGDTLAGEPDKLGCERRESMLTAEGVAYDAPGGGKMGYLSPGTKYVAVTSLRHTDGQSWLLLTAQGGAHIGWIRENQVKGCYLGLGCSIPIHGTYRRPK